MHSVPWRKSNYLDVEGVSYRALAAYVLTMKQIEEISYPISSWHGDCIDRGSIMLIPVQQTSGLNPLTASPDKKGGGNPVSLHRFRILTFFKGIYEVRRYV